MARQLKLKDVYVPDDKPFLEIYFSKNHNFDPELSVDQDFGDNKVYLSDEGDYLITFGVENLSESEFNTLQLVTRRQTPSLPIKEV